MRASLNKHINVQVLTFRLFLRYPGHATLSQRQTFLKGKNKLLKMINKVKAEEAETSLPLVPKMDSLSFLKRCFLLADLN